MDIDNPYAPPKAASPWTDSEGWDGKYFRLRNPGTMPGWCLRCGDDDAPVEQSAKLSWCNPWTYLWFFASILILIIAYLIVVKRVNVSYRYCLDCAANKARWRTAMFVSLALFVLTLVGSIAGKADDTLTMAMAATSTLSFVALLVSMAMRSPSMVVLKHTGGVFYVGRLKRAYRARFGS